MIRTWGMGGSALHPFVDILQAARRASGMSQQRLAEISGYDRKALSRYEAGENIPSIAVVTDLAAALGYEVIIRKVPK